MVTRLEDRPRRKEILTLPSGQTPENTYKYIEDTAKPVGGEGHIPSDKELNLNNGHCKIICVNPGHNLRCRGKEKDKSGLAEEHPLENTRDWTDIEVLLPNYESRHLNHGNIIAIINRKLKIIPRYPSKAEMAQQQRPNWDWLEYEITNSMKKVDGKNQEYMPNDRMENFMTEDIIRGLIEEEVGSLTMQQNEVDLLTDRIIDEARKLLLIFVHGRVELRFMKILLDNGFNDKALPFLEEHPSWLPQGHDHSQYRDINAYKMVRRSQWPFLAVVFDKVYYHHRKLDSDAIIPFRRKEVRGTGAFSVVYRIELEASHQRLYEIPAVSIISTFHCISGTIDIPNALVTSLLVVNVSLDVTNYV